MLESRWLDVAVFSTLYAVLTVIFGRFEEHKPAGRRLAKLALLLALLLALIETTGRAWAYGVIGLLLAAGATLHVRMMSNAGVNPWTAEPRDKFEALRREVVAHGEAATLWRLARALRLHVADRPRVSANRGDAGGTRERHATRSLTPIDRSSP